jgi:hypothetical protein
VTGPYAVAIIVVALALAVWAGLLVALDRPPGRALFVAAGVLEAMLVGFAVGGLVQMVQTDHAFSKGEFVLYLLACVAIPPIAFLWGVGEKARSGTAVLALAFLITPVMVIRVQQVWAG